MRKILPIILLALACIKCFAQIKPQPPFNARDLSISWEGIQNNYKSPENALNALIITNTGKIPFPVEGWTMYFSSSRLLDSNTVSENAKIKYLNGDFYSLKPLSNFSEIKPGTSIRIEFVSKEPILNVTDAPDGFYLVWDILPEAGYNVGNFSVKSVEFSAKYSIKPSVIYDQNKAIKDIPENKLIKVFPTPVQYKETGDVLNLNRFSLIETTSVNLRFEKEGNDLKNYLNNLIGSRADVNPKLTVTKPISIVYVDSLKKDAYELSVTTKGININASTASGAFYAIQSIKSLIKPFLFSVQEKEFNIPCVEIKDEPRFPYRSFMLDVSRNFQTKGEVLKILDVMAQYKLNVFHFHLTDDEGWRLEIPYLPDLTKVGGKRSHTLDSKHSLPPSFGSGGSGGEKDARIGSGYYTRNDFIDIIKYANNLHIQVVPEIEAPGHARAAIVAMKARYNRLMAEGLKIEAEKYLLTDPDDKSVYSSAQHWTDNVMDISRPSTINFVEAIVNNIVSMYKDADVPLTSIHWGGDEVPQNVWEKSPSFAAIKISHSEIKDTQDLWNYFYGSINEFLKDKGVTLSGWEEMALKKTKLDGKPYYIPNPEFVNENLQAEVWNNTIGDGNEDLAYKLANAGYKVVLSCVSNFYFDLAYNNSFDEPGYYWGGYIDIDKPYSFIPYDYFKNVKVDKNGAPVNPNIFAGKQRLTDYGKTNIVGLQSALWGENIKSEKRLEYMLLPRLLAFSERAWSKDPDWVTATDATASDTLFTNAYNSFLNVLGKRELPRLSYFDGGFSYRIPKPGGIYKDGKFSANVQYPGLIIKYTVNGDTPDFSSKTYIEPLSTESAVVRFRTFDVKGRASEVITVTK